jgi:hypothetical protein
MNYVAFAGILAIDNDFFKIQSKKHGDVLEKIEDASGNCEFKLYKSPVFHDRFKESTFLSRVLFGLMKFIYKVIYFYVAPLLVIYIGILGYNINLMDSLEKKKVTKLKKTVPIDNAYIENKYFSAMEKDNTWMFYMLIIYTLPIAIFYMKKNTDGNCAIKLTRFILFYGFLYGFTVLSWFILWPYWYQTEKISWLSWMYGVPLEFTWIHGIIFVANITQLPKRFRADCPEENQNCDTFGTYLIGKLKFLPIFLCKHVLWHIGIKPVILTFVFWVILWCLWKCYILWLLYYCIWVPIKYLSIWFVILPVKGIIWLFTHENGFTALFYFVIFCYVLRITILSIRTYYEKKKDKEEME